MKKGKNIFIIALLGLLILINYNKCFAENLGSKLIKDTSLVKVNWVKRYGLTGQKVSSQIIVDNNLIFTSNNKLYKINKNNGKIINSTNLGGISTYKSPVYGDNKIFVALENGKIEAFDKNNFKKLWTYENELKNNSSCEIIYENKKLYIGFLGESKKGNYVCLSTKDEDENTSKEEKKALWSISIKDVHKNITGKIINSTIIIGGPSNNLYVVDKSSGKILEEYKLKGSINSSFTYENKKVYFTTNNGYLYCGNIDNKKINNLKYTNYNMKNECSPIIYKDRIYIVFKNKDKGKLVVANKNTLKEIYSVDLKGNPQNMILKSDKDNIYLYIAYKNLSGNISLITTNSKVKNSKDIKIENLVDLNDAYKDHTFTNLISDDKGNLYYTNNSSYIISIGQKKEIIISFDPQNGDAIIKKYILEGDILDYAPYIPKKKNHEFQGWYTNIDDYESRYRNKKSYSKNVTYFAKFEKLKDDEKNEDENDSDDNDKNNNDKNNSNSKDKWNNNNINNIDNEQKNEDENDLDKSEKSNNFLYIMFGIAGFMGMFTFIHGSSKF